MSSSDAGSLISDLSWLWISPPVTPDELCLSPSGSGSIIVEPLSPSGSGSAISEPSGTGSDISEASVAPGQLYLSGASGIWTSDELSSNTEDLLHLWPAYQDCNRCT